MSKKKTLIDLYKLYNYPCWDISLLEKGIVPVPYVPKHKLKCDHPYSLTYKKWKEIVLSLFKYIILYLMEGYKLKLPHRLGYMQMRKRKAKSIDKIHLAKTGKVRYITHVETDGYKPILKWDRYNKQAFFSNKHMWTINLLRGTWRDIVSTLHKDYSQINKLIDA